MRYYHFRTYPLSYQIGPTKTVTYSDSASSMYHKVQTQFVFISYRGARDNLTFKARENTGTGTTEVPTFCRLIIFGYLFRGEKRKRVCKFRGDAMHTVQLKKTSKSKVKPIPESVSGLSYRSFTKKNENQCVLFN